MPVVLYRHHSSLPGGRRFLNCISAAGKPTPGDVDNLLFLGIPYGNKTNPSGSDLAHELNLLNASGQMLRRLRDTDAGFVRSQ